MGKKEILILLLVLCVAATFILSLLGLAGYFFYIGLNEQSQAADGPPARPTYMKETVGKAPKAGRSRSGGTRPGTPPVTRLVVEKSRAETTAEDVSQEIQGAIELFEEGKFKMSHNQFTRAIGRMYPYSSEFIGEVSGEEWTKAKVEAYTNRVRSRATEMQQLLAAGKLDLTLASDFLHIYGRSSSCRQAVKPFNDAMQAHLQDLLSKKVLVTVSTPHAPYRDAIAKALKGKTSRNSKYDLVFAKDLPPIRNAKPFVGLSIYLRETYATYRLGQGGAFRVPNAVTIRFNIRKDYHLKTSWDKLNPTIVKAKLTAELPAGAKANDVIAEVRTGLLPAIEKKLNNAVPEFSLFPSVNIKTARLITSSKRLDIKVLAALAARDPELLKRRVKSLISDPPSHYTIPNILGGLVKYDAEECSDLVINNMGLLKAQNMSTFISNLRYNVDYADFAVALKVVTRPSGVGVIRYLRPYFGKKAVFAALDGYCRDPKTANRPQIVYQFLSNLSPEQRKAYWQFMVDKNENVAEMAVRALRFNSDEFPNKFIEYYDRMQDKARVTGWGNIQNLQVLSEKRRVGVIELAAKVVKENKGKVEQAAMRAISSGIRDPRIWGVCVGLLPHIDDIAERGYQLKMLVNNAPENKEGAVFLEKLLADQNKEAVAIISNPSKIRQRFYNEPRTAIVSRLLRVSADPHTVIKRISIWIKNTPADEPLVYAALISIAANARKIDFTWTEVDRLIRMGFAGADTRTRRQSHMVIRLASKTNKTKYVSMVKNALSAEKDRRARYDLEQLLRYISR